MQKEDLKHLLDEMIEIEKEMQEENARRTAIEKQFFEALGECELDKANELLASMDNNLVLELQARFNELKEKARTLMKEGEGNE